MANPLIDVQKHGQSIWFDNISRDLITSGELRAMVENDGLLGVTSNPSIFEKALASGVAYDPATKALVLQGVEEPKDIFEHLAIQDIQLATDIFYPVYQDTEGRDGFISMEVSPHLAHDTEATVAEARRLHKTICRDNLMIKVPATPKGIPAIRELISDGINVNVTLLFSVDMYGAAARAYMEGLEKRLAAGEDITRVASVASFFVSRVDSLVDKKLEETGDKNAESLFGKVAVANSKLAYVLYQELSATKQWQRLAAKDARPQRLLWASTSTKNPKYSKTLYVDELIGADTVNTVPDDTFRAFKTGGTVAKTLTQEVDKAREIVQTLEKLGVSMKEVTDQLLAEGVQKFSDAFDQLLGSVAQKRDGILELTQSR
jgi:transaldolase/glucose-6-phosphate isomerase